MSIAKSMAAFKKLVQNIDMKNNSAVGMLNRFASSAGGNVSL